MRQYSIPEYSFLYWFRIFGFNIRVIIYDITHNFITQTPPPKKKVKSEKRDWHYNESKSPMYVGQYPISQMFVILIHSLQYIVSLEEYVCFIFQVPHLNMWK